ncbi:MAG: hypothetical protein KAH64_03920, partial [Nitrosomonadaceae bacterium]|nr:hypothetical protein [Nitrosomonadaceae bacterium]
MLHPALFVLAISLALPAFAADTSGTSSMEILRQKITADKKFLVVSNMKLTDAEAKEFWPIYKAYQKDLHQINDRLAKVIKDYAEAYNKGALSDDTAKKLLNEAIAIELAEVKLKQSYIPKLDKILPATKVARYIQIETKIRAIIRYGLADGIPLVH